MHIMARNITLEEARSLLTVAATDKALADFVKRAGSEYLSRTDTSETARGQAMAAAALATHVASVTGHLLPEGERESADSVGLGSSSFCKEFAGMKGDKPAVSPTNVPHWRTLGHLLVVVGVPVEFSKRGEDKSTWQLASQTPGDVLKAATFADGATPESVREALLTVRHPDGSRIASPRQGGRGTARTTGEDGQTVAEMIAADPVKAAITACEALAAACKAIPEDDSDGWAKVENAMQAILHREVTTRTGKAAKKAASKRTSRRLAPTG